MIEYSEINQADTDWIISWTHVHLTRGDYVTDCIRKSAALGNYYGVKASDQGKIVGFLTFKRGIDFTYPHPELEERILRLADAEETFSGDGIFVDPAYRRAGIGRRMTRLARRKMLSLGGRFFLGELWIYPDGRTPSASPTDDYGQTVYEETVPLFYRDNRRYGLECAICGKNCRCGAVVRLVRL